MTARLVSVAFNFLVVLSVSRSLGPVAKGETTLWITTIFIGVFASNIAGGYALANYLKRNENAPVLIPAYVWSLLASAVFSLMACTALGRATGFATHLFILTALSSFTSVHQTLLLSNFRFKGFNFLFFVQPFILWLVLAFGLYVFEIKTIQSFVTALYISVGITFLLSLSAIFKSGNSSFAFSFFHLKRILRNGFPFQLAELLQLLHLRLYFFFLAGFDESGLYKLGLYSVGISILESVWIFSRSVATINFAATIKSPSATNTLRWLRISLLFSFIALIAIFAVPIKVYGWVFGEGFLYVKYSVKYLFPGIGFYVIVLVLGSHFMGKEKYSLMSTIHLIGIAVSLLLCKLWIPDYKMSGAGMAATVSFAISSLLVLFYFFKTENFSWRNLVVKKEDFKF